MQKQYAKERKLFEIFYRVSLVILCITIFWDYCEDKFVGYLKRLYTCYSTTKKSMGDVLILFFESTNIISFPVNTFLCIVSYVKTIRHICSPLIKIQIDVRDTREIIPWENHRLKGMLFQTQWLSFQMVWANTFFFLLEKLNKKCSNITSNIVIDWYMTYR